MPGTLALSTAEPVRATITGPFGSTVATYSDGALKGEKFAPVEIESGSLLSLLAGVWRAPGPEVRGIEGDDALLVWTVPSRAQGILHLPTARFTSLSVERGGKAYEASYSGPCDPWPARVNLKDVASSSTLHLTLVGREPAP